MGGGAIPPLMLFVIDNMEILELGGVLFRPCVARVLVIFSG